LCDPARIGLGERPLLHSRQLLGEECVRTVEDLLEKAGQTPIKRGAVARSEDPRPRCPPRRRRRPRDTGRLPLPPPRERRPPEPPLQEQAAPRP
jgi:hypothetical protein